MSHLSFSSKDGALRFISFILTAVDLLRTTTFISYSKFVQDVGKNVTESNRFQ
jgi:hypothetical protein